MGGSKKKIYCCCKIDPWCNKKGMKHVNGCLEDNFPDTNTNTKQITWKTWTNTNNLKNNQNAEDIATVIMNQSIFVKIEKKTLVVSGINVRNDKLNG